MTVDCCPGMTVDWCPGMTVDWCPGMTAGESVVADMQPCRS